MFMTVEQQTFSPEKKCNQNIKQQIKLLTFIETGNTASFADVSQEDINPDNHDKLLNNFESKYYSNLISEDTIKPLLLEIDPPMTLRNIESHGLKRDDIFEKVSNNELIMNTIEYLSRDGFNQPEIISPYDLESILLKCPTPIEFYEKFEAFVGDFMYKSSEDTISEYKTAGDEFAKIFYGKRFEYYKCFKDIESRTIEKQRNYGNAQVLTPEMYEKPQIDVIDAEKRKGFGKGVLGRIFK